MTGPAVEFHDLIGNLLKADAAVTDIVGDRVYDAMPDSGAYPCITFGSSDFIEDDVECIIARRQTQQIDCWVQQNGKLWPAMELVDAVKVALHRADASLGSHALVSIEVGLVRVFLDQDQITAHGVVQVTGLIEEA